MPKFVARVANLPLVGEKITKLPTGGFVRNRIDLRLGRKRLRLVQHQDVVVGPVSKFNGERVSTGRLIFENVREAQAKSVLSIATDLAWLLSFATGSHVAISRWSCGRNNGTLPVGGAFHIFRPLLARNDGRGARELVEQCWPQFRALKRRRALQVVIHLLLLSEEPETPLQLQLLAAVLALENLKATFARENGIPFLDGHFRKPPKPGQLPKNAAPYYFGPLLGMMFRSVGMRRQFKRVVAVRNEIVHFGVSRRSFSSLLTQYGRIQDLLREYILRLLGYTGQYYSYSNPRGPLECLRA